MSAVADLISPCLVPFQALPRLDATVLYCAPDLEMSERDLLDRFSYTICTDSSNESAAGKVFYAERYGGIGVGPHGGGARCGYDGTRYQIKGIGPNPLVGFTEATGQKDGILSLQSALHEMIWSRILQDALPFGTVQCLAVIAIGSPKPQDMPRDVRGNRALLIREACIRPAHFERAAYFRTQPHDPVADRSLDVLRVVEICQKLPDILETAFNRPGDSPENTVFDGLCELARRQSLQLAFARSHFLYHSISSSNVSLDGRWLDFTSMTPMHTKDSAAKPTGTDAWPRLWDQASIVTEVLASLVFHYTKFMRLPDSTCRTWTNEITAQFSRNLERASAKYWLCIAGVPLTIATRLCSEDHTLQWAAHLYAILRFRWPKIDQHVDPARSAAERFLLDLTFSATSNHPPSTLGMSDQEAVEYHARRTRVKERVQEAALDCGIPTKNLMIGMTLNSIKFSAEKNDLSFAEMQKNISDVIERSASNAGCLASETCAYAARILTIAKFRLVFDPEFVVTCWEDDRMRVIYDMMSDHFTVSRDDETEYIPRALASQYFETNRPTQIVVNFYRRFNASFVFGC